MEVLSLLAAGICIYWAHKLLVTPHPAWKYMSEEEQQFYKKWFIYPRLWKPTTLNNRKEQE